MWILFLIKQTNDFFLSSIRLTAMEDLTRYSWMLKWKRSLPDRVIEQAAAVATTTDRRNSMWHSSSAMLRLKTAMHNDSRIMTAIVSAFSCSCRNFFPSSAAVYFGQFVFFSVSVWWLYWFNGDKFTRFVYGELWKKRRKHRMNSSEDPSQIDFFYHRLIFIFIFIYFDSMEPVKNASSQITFSNSENIFIWSTLDSMNWTHFDWWHWMNLKSHWKN